MKRFLLFFLLLFSLSSCAVEDILSEQSAEDAMFFVAGQIDAIYRNRYSNAYLTLLESTEAELRPLSQEHFAQKGEYLLDFLNCEEPSTELQEAAELCLRKIYQTISCTVSQGEQLPNGDFQISLTVTPVEIFHYIDQDFLLQTWQDMEEQNPEVSTSELQDIYGFFLLEDIQSRIYPMTYGTEQHITIRLVKTKQGYQFDESDWRHFDEVVLDYFGKYS